MKKKKNTSDYLLAIYTHTSEDDSWLVICLWCTLFLKRNATFWTLPFFQRRVYTSESGLIFLDEVFWKLFRKPICRFPMIQEKSMKKSCVSFEIECILEQCCSFMCWMWFCKTFSTEEVKVGHDSLSAKKCGHLKNIFMSFWNIPVFCLTNCYDQT